MFFALLDDEHIISQHNSILIKFTQSLKSGKYFKIKFFLDESHLLRCIFDLRSEGKFVGFMRIDDLIVFQKLIIIESVL